MCMTWLHTWHSVLHTSFSQLALDQTDPGTEPVTEPLIEPVVQ
jgi:hypothetical protein